MPPSRTTSSRWLPEITVRQVIRPPPLPLNPAAIALRPMPLQRNRVQLAVDCLIMSEQSRPFDRRLPSSFAARAWKQRAAVALLQWRFTQLRASQTPACRRSDGLGVSSAPSCRHTRYACPGTVEEAVIYHRARYPHGDAANGKIRLASHDRCG